MLMSGGADPPVSRNTPWHGERRCKEMRKSSKEEPDVDRDGGFTGEGANKNPAEVVADSLL